MNLKIANSTKVLECDDCGDIVIPRHNMSFKEMKETSCSACVFGKLKPQQRNVVKKEDVEQLIRKKINTMHEVESNRERDRAEKANYVRNELEELLEDVQDES